MTTPVAAPATKNGETKEDMDTYVGIADAHGIESLIPKKTAKEGASSPFLLKMRAASNNQRHAVYFEIKMTKKVLKSVLKKLKDKDYESALNIIKEEASEIGTTNNHSWSMIPNPKLDPYYSGE